MNARSSQALTALPLLALALALVAVPAAAQDVTPPPVAPTQASPAPAAPQTVVPPPVVATSPAPAAPAASSDGSATAIDPQAAANAAAERPPAGRRPRTTAASQTVARARTAPAAAVAPPTAAAVTPTAATPAPAAEAPIPLATAPAPARAQPAAPEQAASARERSAWPWLVAALAVVGIAAGLLIWRRRRAREQAWEETAYTTEPVYAEPVQPEPVAYAPDAMPAARPVVVAAAAPAVADRGPVTPASNNDVAVATVEEASVAHADAGDVEALTAGAPVGDRPWLELAMRPVRAGTTEDDARVEIELTVGNAGPVDAEDVRVSAFMLADADDGEIERMLVNPPAADAVEPLRIGAGEGTRVDATLTLPRASLASEARFRPVVIAEARYRLPGGGEGRTAASFDVGMVGDPDAPLAPVTTAGTEMRDDVEARLHRAAEHA